MRILPGDILGTASPSFLGRAIRWATRQRGEPPSIVNHNAIAVTDAPLDAVEIVEASRRVRRVSLWRQYRHSGTHVEIWRPLNLTDEDRCVIIENACRRVGEAYPYHHLLLQLLDEKLLAGRYFFRRLAFLDRWHLCTPLVVECYWPTGKHFGLRDPDEANPDNLRDFLESNPDKYKRILALTEL